MLKHTIAIGVAASLMGVAPQTAQADIKDGLIGGVVGGAVGALVTESIRNNNKKKSSPKTTTSTRATTTTRSTSLNSQYSRSERIQIQTALNGLGYNVGTVDGVLGKRSRAGISAFQATRNEPRTGQLTAAQFAALTMGGVGNAQAAFLPSNRALQTNEVFLLQQSLWQMGYFQGTIDGVYSVTTQNAATSFLLSQNRNPVQTTHVQTLVLAAGAVGQTVPNYLVDEANAQYVAAQSGNVFGAPSTQGNTQLGTTMVNQQQGGDALFGAPAQPAAGQTQEVFGTQPQPQQQLQQAPATNNLFGTVPQQPVQQQQQPEANGVLVSAPQAGEQTEILSTKDAQGTTQTNTGLFAMQTQPTATTDGSTTAPQAAFQADAGSNLDIFSGNN